MKKNPIIAFALILLTGCAVNNPDSISEIAQPESTSLLPAQSVSFSSEGTDDLWDDFFFTEEAQPDPFAEYSEAVRRKYPDKEVLVWAFDSYGWEDWIEPRTELLNSYLTENGRDYVVCFKPIEEEYHISGSIVIPDKAMEEILAEMSAAGEPVDIIHTPVSYVQQGAVNQYQRYSMNGLFEPLDGYFDTEAGRKLYSLMPEKHWDSLRVNGSIYGIDGTMSELSSDYGYYVNIELAQKYGLDISKPISEQTDILEKVRQNEDCDVFAATSGFDDASDYARIRTFTPALYLDPLDGSAKCVLDNADYIGRLRELSYLQSLGLLTKVNFADSGGDFFIYCRSERFAGARYFGVTETQVDYLGSKVSAIPVFTEQSYIAVPTNSTGIYSGSQHKDSAFELIALSQTDQYINNLLTYGIEGEDYSVSANGEVNIEYEDTTFTDRFANYMVCLPSELHGGAEHYNSVFERAEVIPGYGFAFDASAVTEQCNDTTELIFSLTLPEYDSFDETISGLREQLYGAGLQDILDEFDRQYSEGQQ